MPNGKTDLEADTEIWRAGDLELDVGLQRVLQDGKPVELPRLSFELLLTLMQASPRFVSNEEFMQRVWKGLVVSPETVTQRIKLLRDALGDDPLQRRYIEGLRGRGYRLIPPAVRDEVGIVAASVEVPAAVDQVPDRKFPLRWFGLAAGLMLLAGIAIWMPRGTAPPAVPLVATAADRTAAILPFKLAGTFADGEAIALGLTESVLAQLSEVRGLTIISSESSSKPDAEKLGLAQTGKLLGARYLVQGLIQQSGEQRRVTVRLTDSLNGTQIWTQQYDLQERDFFGLQDAVAAGVMGALQSRIAGLDPTVPAGARSQNHEAHLAYLRGRKLLGRTTIVDSVAAAAEFESASSLDPAFVPALVGLYDARLQAASLRRQDMGKALAENAPLLARAKELQPDSGAELLARAMWSRESTETRAGYFERGLELDVANARAMTAYSELLDSNGRRQEGAEWLERALRIDPLWPRARFRHAQRNFPVVGAAIEQQNLRLLELDPYYYPALQRRAKYQWQQNNEIVDAIAVIERAIAADPENPWGRHTAVAFYLDVNEPDSAEDLVRGQEVAAASTRALRAQYRGDWRAAGLAALEARSFTFGGPERWGVPPALRDYALRGLQTERIMQLLVERYNLPLDQDWKLAAGNFREGQMLAHLLLATDRREEGMRRLDQVIAWIDANPHMGPVYNFRTKANALVLKGEVDAALENLAESFKLGDYTHWWYTLQYDPTWNALRADPRFVAIADTVRARVGTQVAALAEMRNRKLVPDRRSGATSGTAGRP